MGLEAPDVSTPSSTSSFTFLHYVSRIITYIVSRCWTVLLVLVAWHVWVSVNRYNPIVMPGPASVAEELTMQSGLYLQNAAITFGVALAGTTCGLAIGTGFALACWMSRVVEGLLVPLTILFSSVPVVAIIPILARVLGYDVSTVIAAVAVITFFPSFVFISSGLKALPPGGADFFKVCGASRAAILMRLALPAAVPSFAVALRLAAANGVLAAMVAEFLMGTSGLGYLFEVTKSEGKMESAMATSLVATGLSIVFFLAASAFERAIRERWI